MKKGLSAGEAREGLKLGRPDREEILDLLGEQARDGHVPAMRLLLEELRRDGEVSSDTSAIDELARRRAG